MPARYARAIALYRKGDLGSALLTIDGLLKEYPNDPYFHEVRAQMLYENGRAAESIASYRRAVQLPAGGRRSSRSTSRAPCSTPTVPSNDREAIRNLELAMQQESGSFELWRPLASGYSKQNNAGHDVARARRDGGPARPARRGAVARRGRRTQLQPGTPAWQRAQDIKAYINRPAAQVCPATLENNRMRSLLLATLVGLIVIGAAVATRTALPEHHRSPESSRRSRCGCSSGRSRQAASGPI